MRAVVGVVVVHDDRHGQLQARHVPERGRPEDERAVAQERNHLFARTRQRDARRGADAGPEMRAVVEEQLASAARIELETMLDFDRARFVNDDGIPVGPLRDFVGDAIGFHRARIPQRVARHEGTQLPRLIAPRAHVARALRNRRLHRGRQQLIDGRDQIVGSVRDVRHERRVGPHDAADARAVIPQVDELRLA